MTTVFARRPFAYGNLHLERGEVFDLREGRREDSMLDHRRLVAKVGDRETVKCDCGCGKQFLTEVDRQSHLRHAQQHETNNVNEKTPEEIRLENLYSLLRL